MRLALLLVLAGAVLFFVKHKKDALIRQVSHFLQTTLSRSADLDIRVGWISGKLLGTVKFHEVRVEDPGLPEGPRGVFTAETVEFRYRLLDFFSKNRESRMEVIVRNPVFHLRPRTAGLRRPRSPLLAWMRQWALAPRPHMAVRLENLKVVFGDGRAKIGGIQGLFEDNRFTVEIPLRHLELAGADISSTIHAQGQFEIGAMNGEDSIGGRLRTEGTVINWKPLPKESFVDFVLTRDAFTFGSSDFLGGLHVAGRIDFEKDYDIELGIEAVRFPLSNFDVFVKSGANVTLPGRLDLEASLEGYWRAPSAEFRARIHDGGIGSKSFKIMDVHASGVCPTLRLSDSRMLAADGSVMKFADKALEIWDFFKEKTYHELVDESQQENVVWGNWEFRRPRDAKDQDEFLMQRSLGDNTRLHVRRFNEEALIGQEQREPVEVGFEYRLRSKDSLKFELREEEQFVGVERKMKF